MAFRPSREYIAHIAVVKSTETIDIYTFKYSFKEGFEVK